MGRLSPESNKRKNYKHRYGLTPDQVDAMKGRYDGRCWICLNPPAHGKHKVLYVDHDHATGRVRGMLCHRCNTAIAALGDSVATVRRALDYLRGVLTPMLPRAAGEAHVL